jgi:hypothetical protein
MLGKYPVASKPVASQEVLSSMELVWIFLCRYLSRNLAVEPVSLDVRSLYSALVTRTADMAELNTVYLCQLYSCTKSRAYRTWTMDRTLTIHRHHVTASDVFLLPTTCRYPFQWTCRLADFDTKHGPRRMKLRPATKDWRDKRLKPSRYGKETTPSQTHLDTIISGVAPVKGSHAQLWPTSSGLTFICLNKLFDSGCSPMSEASDRRALRI